MKYLEEDTAYLIDANVVLEVLYKRSRWEESYKLLKKVREGLVRALMLHFAIHAISAMLGNPDLVAKLLTEISSWRGLTIVDLSIHDGLVACELASRTGLDFDDGLHYYLAKRRNIPIVSFDKDFDKLDIKRIEPHEIIV
ncbi:MAG: PIN domain-containing protein [Aigarchaeota archaeon]|nr:PIN domain-containing protein [Aigarchaeota archaeon]